MVQEPKPFGTAIAVVKKDETRRSRLTASQSPNSRALRYHQGCPLRLGNPRRRVLGMARKMVLSAPLLCEIDRPTRRTRLVVRCPERSFPVPVIRRSTRLGPPGIGNVGPRHLAHHLKHVPEYMCRGEKHKIRSFPRSRRNPREHESNDNMSLVFVNDPGSRTRGLGQEGSKNTWSGDWSPQREYLHFYVVRCYPQLLELSANSNSSFLTLEGAPSVKVESVLDHQELPANLSITRPPSLHPRGSGEAFFTCSKERDHTSRNHFPSRLHLCGSIHDPVFFDDLPDSSSTSMRNWDGLPSSPLFPADRVPCPVASSSTSEAVVLTTNKSRPLHLPAFPESCLDVNTGHSGTY